MRIHEIHGSDRFSRRISAEVYTQAIGSLGNQVGRLYWGECGCGWKSVQSSRYGKTTRDTEDHLRRNHDIDDITMTGRLLVAAFKALGVVLLIVALLWIIFILKMASNH